MNWNFSTLEVILGTAFSMTGVYLAYKRYALKSGVRFRGSYSPTSTVYCAEPYVSRVAIENVKDRASTIYAIYLQIGPSIYLTIEDFGDEPLVLAGFATYQKDFDPIDFYTEGSRRFELKQLLDDQHVKKRLVLSTSDGKYIVRKWIRRWDPISLFFKNFATAIAYPIRITYKDKSYGSNAVYIVELGLADGTEQVIPIYSRDYEYKRFRSFSLTQESLASREALEELLNQERELGNLLVRWVEVKDLAQMRANSFKNEFSETIVATKTSAIDYYVFGPILTRIAKWRLKQENKKRRRGRG